MALKTPDDFVSEFKAGFDADDVDAILELYSDAIVVVPQAGLRLHGLAEMRTNLSAMLAMKPCTLEFTSDGVVESADAAVVYGSWTFDGASFTGPVHIEARATVVLTRQDDLWYAVIDDFFSGG